MHDALTEHCNPAVLQPYYEDEFISLYCSGMREILPLLDAANVCVADVNGDSPDGESAYAIFKENLQKQLTPGTGAEESKDV